MTAPALPAVARKGFGRREGVLLFLLVAAAVVSAVLFEAATRPERVHDPRHHARFALDCEALPALGALRVRSDAPPNEIAAFGVVMGITPDVTGPFRRTRYLRASEAEVAEALAALDRGEAPTPPPVPDLSRCYRDALGPYRCDLLFAPGKRPADVRAAFPAASLSGEPLAREAEEAEARSVARGLLVGLLAVALWLTWRCGILEAERRLLAPLGALAVLGLFGTGVDRWSVAALLLVAGAPGGAPLLAAAPCLFFPSLALQRLGLILCLGGALRLLMRRPALPRSPDRPRAIRAAMLAAALGILGFLLLHAVPLRAAPKAEVAAEPGALLVRPPEVQRAARALRAAGFDVTGDEPLLPPTPEPARRRSLWKIFTRARTLALASEGETRARFEDAADAAAGVSLTTLPRDLRQRLRTRDGRAALWALSDADRPELSGARLYRLRGDIELRANARLAAIVVLVAGVLALAVLEGASGAILLRFIGAAAGAALLFLADPAAADAWLPLLPLAVAAPALGPALALGAAALFLPALFWPAAALLVASSVVLPRRHAWWGTERDEV